MSDVTLNYPVAERGGLPSFGLIAVIILALVSAAAGVSNPAAIVAEYQAGSLS